MIKSLIGAAKKIGGERFKDLIKETNNEVNPGRTEMEEQFLQNISIYCKEEEAGLRGRRAAILTNDIEMSLKEKSKWTGTSMSMISKARERISKGVFRITKVFYFYFYIYFLFI